MEASELNFKILISCKVLAFISFIFLFSIKNIPWKKILLVFILSALLQAILAILQFGLNHDLGLQFLGEPILNSNLPHLSNFLGSTHIRAYGTFPHPNILAYYLSLALIILQVFVKKWGSLEWSVFGILLLALFTTLSRTAIIFTPLLLFYLLIKNSKHKWIFFLLPLPFLLGVFILRPLSVHDASLQDRLLGIQDAWLLWLDSPIWGQGFHTYTLALESLTNRVLMPWDYQPVHNTYLLCIVELGLLGLLSFSFLFILLMRKLWYHKNLFSLLLPLLVFSFFEHYFLSLDQGIYISIFTILIVLQVAAHPKSLYFRLKNPWHS